MNFEEEIKKLYENLDQNVKDITQKIEALQKEKQEAAKPKERFWRPKVDDKYFFINGMFQCNSTINNFFDSDYKYINNANCYKESESNIAKQDAARMRAQRIIQRVADELHGGRYDFVQLENNYIPYYSKEMAGIYIEKYSQTNVGGIYFKTRELAEKCRELCKEEYKILLGVDE